MIKTIDFMNGKKTAIGFIFLFLAGGLRVFYTDSGWSMPDYLNGLCGLLDYFGYGFGGIGVVDKFRKGELSMVQSDTVTSGYAQFEPKLDLSTSWVTTTTTTTDPNEKKYQQQ